jgi:hypothetical protein
MSEIISREIFVKKTIKIIKQIFSKSLFFLKMNKKHAKIHVFLFEELSFMRNYLMIQTFALIIKKSFLQKRSDFHAPDLFSRLF